MRSAARRFVRQEEGQDLIEYALLCALLAVACITGILNLTRIVEFFARVGVVLDNAI
jgi:Flp pilus assembly pilin Flp